jgi:hypothetical protein
MRRENPAASDEETEARVRAWLRRPGGEAGDRLQVRGYALASLVQQDHVSDLATARLIRPQVFPCVRDARSSMVISA